MNITDVAECKVDYHGCLLSLHQYLLCVCCVNVRGRRLATVTGAQQAFAGAATCRTLRR